MSYSKSKSAGRTYVSSYEMTLNQNAFLISLLSKLHLNFRLYKTVADRPWLADEVFPQRKAAHRYDEERELVVERITVEEEFEPKVETRLPRDKPARRAEYREEEKDDDYDEFIDERLQKTLPIATAEQIPEKTVRREKIPAKDVEIDREEPVVRPSAPEERRVEDRERTPVDSTTEDVVSREPDRAPTPTVSEDRCDDTCPLIIKQKGELLLLSPS